MDKEENGVQRYTIRYGQLRTANRLTKGERIFTISTKPIFQHVATKFTAPLQSEHTAKEP